MLNSTQITIVGNVGEDPELRFTPAGVAVCTFSVAVTPRRFDKSTNQWIDGEATWWRINIWRQLGEHAAETLTKGQRVIVVGNVASRKWKNDKGESGTSWEITAEACGPDLTWATAKVTRSSKRDGATMPEDPWGAGTGNGGSEWGNGSDAEKPF